MYKYLYNFFQRDTPPPLPPVYEELLSWVAEGMCMKAWISMPLSCTYSCTGMHSCKLTGPQQQYHDPQLFTLNGQNPSVLWSDLKRLSNTGVIILPFPCRAVRRKASPPRATGQRRLIPPRQQHGKQQYSKHCVKHIPCVPLTKSYRSEERTPKRKLQGMLSWPSWLFPYNNQGTSNRTSSSLV